MLVSAMIMTMMVNMDEDDGKCDDNDDNGDDEDANETTTGCTRIKNISDKKYIGKTRYHQNGS